MELLPLVNRAHKILQPILGPLDRHPHLYCKIGHEEIFGIENGLGTKAAPDIGCDYMDSALLKRKEVAQGPTEEMGNLGGCPNTQDLQPGVVLGHDHTTFHGMATTSFDRKPLLEEMIRLLPRCLEVSHLLEHLCG